MILPVYAQVDLTNGRWRKCTISAKLFERYLGGKAMGARLLTDLTPPGVDPLSPEAMLIINTGPMNDTGAPSSSRFNMTFKNVLTGGIASSNCGGPFGMLLKKAGFDGLILCGKAPELSMVVVEDGRIRIERCPQFQGLDTERIQEELPERYGKLVIGPAGENQVRFACAASGERVAGRCGAGAVMGSKNLKAVIAFGTREVVKADPEGFEAHTRKWVKQLKKHPMTGDSLPRYGSAGLVSKANASGVLPTRNFTRGRYEHYEDVSGETLADTRLTRNSGCVSCPIRCERRVKVGGKEVKGPEYETLGLFGPNVENRDLDLINELNYRCDLLGMDTISLAGTIAFAMELQERGMGDFGLKPDQPADLLRVVEDVAYRRGPVGALAGQQGPERAVRWGRLRHPRQGVGAGLLRAPAERGHGSGIRHRQPGRLPPERRLPGSAGVGGGHQHGRPDPQGQAGIDDLFPERYGGGLCRRVLSVHHAGHDPRLFVPLRPCQLCQPGGGQGPAGGPAPAGADLEAHALDHAHQLYAGAPQQVHRSGHRAAHDHREILYRRGTQLQCGAALQPAGGPDGGGRFPPRAAHPDPPGPGGAGHGGAPGQNAAGVL